jgi:hypothetical protein
MDRAWSQRLGHLLAALCAMMGTGPVPAVASQTEFDRLLAAAKDDPAHADFPRLRRAFAQSPHYNPYGEPFDPGPVRQEVANGERVAGLLALDRVLEGHWMDLDAQRFAAAACRRLGETDRAERHAAFHEGLLRAILEAGDGRSFETAWPVLSVAEEYHILGLLRLEVEAQALTERDGHTFDVLTVKDHKTGDSFKVYFNIDAPHRWLTQRLEQRGEKTP